MTDQNTLKRAVASKALEYVQDGMKLGLGSGSTAEIFVEMLAPMVRGGAKLLCVPTSEKTAALARKRQMLAAYDSAERFLRLTPGMPMADLQCVHPVGPVAALGSDCRAALREQLGCSAGERLVLVAFGGFSKRLPIESWPPLTWIMSPGSPITRLI